MNNGKAIPNHKNGQESIVTEIFDQRVRKTIEEQRKKFISRSNNDD